MCTVLMTVHTFSLFQFKSSSEILTDLLEKRMVINDNSITNPIMWCDIKCGTAIFGNILTGIMIAFVQCLHRCSENGFSGGMQF